MQGIKKVTEKAAGTKVKEGKKNKPDRKHYIAQMYFFSNFPATAKN